MQGCASVSVTAHGNSAKQSLIDRIYFYSAIKLSYIVSHPFFFPSLSHFHFSFSFSLLFRFSLTSPHFHLASSPHQPISPLSSPPQTSSLPCHVLTSLAPTLFSTVHNFAARSSTVPLASILFAQLSANQNIVHCAWISSFLNCTAFVVLFTHFLSTLGPPCSSW